MLYTGITVFHPSPSNISKLEVVARIPVSYSGRPEFEYPEGFHSLPQSLNANTGTLRILACNTAASVSFVNVTNDGTRTMQVKTPLLSK